MKVRKRHILTSLAIAFLVASGVCVWRVNRWWVNLRAGRGPMDPPKMTIPSGGSAVAYSPDGRYFAASAYPEITIWDRATWQPWRQLPTDTFERSLTFSPDSTLLASPGAEGRLIVWDVEKGTSRHTFKCELERDGGQWDVRVRAVCFSPDGQTIAASVVSLPPKSLPQSRPQAGVYSWDVMTGNRKLRVWEELLGRWGEFASLATFSPSGTLIATAINGRVALWDSTTGERQLYLPGRADASDTHHVEYVQFTPRGESIVYGGGIFNEPDIATVWELATKKERRISGPTQPGDWGWVQSLALSPDGRTLASAELVKGASPRWGEIHRSGCRIRLWDVQSGELLRTFWHTREFHSLAFSPDGTELAAGCGRDYSPGGKEEGAVCIWDVPVR